jgi:hypothetical protein
MPLKTAAGQEPYHIYLQRESFMFQPVHRLSGFCYMYLINPQYHGEYQWPPQPTMAQLARIPKEMRDNWSAKITWVDHGIYHLEPDTNPGYRDPWTYIEKMGSDPKQMLYVLGMDDNGPPDFPSALPTPVMEGGLNNIEDLINVITQLQETVQNLQHQNHKLQDQMAVAQAGGIMPAPPPWAPPGVAPGVIHGVGMPPPIVNINAVELGAAIAHALPPAPAPQASRGPTAREPEPFSGKMENMKPFIWSCQIYIEIKQAQFASQQIAIMWVLLYMMKGSADPWRENILNQFAGEFEVDPFTQVNQLYRAIEVDFGDLNERTTKVMALKKLRQGTNTYEEHIQAFRQLAWGSGYEGAPLIDEFKRLLHPKLRQKLMEAETPPVVTTIAPITRTESPCPRMCPMFLIHPCRYAVTACFYFCF